MKDAKNWEDLIFLLRWFVAVHGHPLIPRFYRIPVPPGCDMTVNENKSSQATAQRSGTSLSFVTPNSKAAKAAMKYNQPPLRLVNYPLGGKVMHLQGLNLKSKFVSTYGEERKKELEDLGFVWDNGRYLLPSFD